MLTERIARRVSPSFHSTHAIVMSAACANCVQCRLIGTVKTMRCWLHDITRVEVKARGNLFLSFLFFNFFFCWRLFPGVSLDFFGSRVGALIISVPQGKGTLTRGETIRLSHEPRHPTPIEKGYPGQLRLMIIVMILKWKICIERMKMCCQKFSGEIGHKLLERKKN